MNVRQPVPPLVGLGIFAVEAAGGDVPGIAQLVDVADDWLPDADLELVFCEGFARDAERHKYSWELATRDGWFIDTGEWPPPIATVSLGPASTATVADVIERDTSGWSWTQVIVRTPSFGRAALEALASASPERLALFFSLVNEDDDEDQDVSASPSIRMR